MNQLINDVQVVILSYLRPKDIIMFAYSTKEHQMILDELTIHNGFVVHCKEVVSQWVIDWFQEHNITLKLFKKCVRFKLGQGWFQNGKLHRDDDLPAIVNANGSNQWYQNGKLHRDNDLPAIVWENGSNEWFRHGRRYRKNDLSVIVNEDGS